MQQEASLPMVHLFPFLNKLLENPNAKTSEYQQWHAL
jgi:hypothetical protein